MKYSSAIHFCFPLSLIIAFRQHCVTFKEKESKKPTIILVRRGELRISFLLLLSGRILDVLFYSGIKCIQSNNIDAININFNICWHSSIHELISDFVLSISTFYLPMTLINVIIIQWVLYSRHSCSLSLRPSWLKVIIFIIIRWLHSNMSQFTIAEAKFHLILCPFAIPIALRNLIYSQQ